MIPLGQLKQHCSNSTNGMRRLRGKLMGPLRGFGLHGALAALITSIPIAGSKQLFFLRDSLCQQLKPGRHLSLSR